MNRIQNLTVPCWKPLLPKKSLLLTVTVVLSVKLSSNSASHDGQTHFFALSSERTAPGLELFGYDAPPKLTLVAYNASFTSGTHEDLPEGVDASAIKYIESYSVISEEDAVKAREVLAEAFNRFNVEMCLPH